MHANYGIDAPGVLRAMGSVAVIGIVVAVVAFVVGFLSVIAWTALGIGIYFFSLTALHLRYSKVAKLRERSRLIDQAGLHGDEVVLDVGCGRGLLLVEAGRRLGQGHAVGVDIWSAVDQSGNTPAATIANARAEGVPDRIDVCTGDARGLPFATGGFDVVVSQFAIHNIRDSDGRRRALREIDRVLRPGGRLVVVDLARTGEYCAALDEAGWVDVDRSRLVWRLFPPARYVIATKPG